MAQAKRSAQVGKGILQYAPARFFEPVLGLVVIPILTRVLGTAGYGLFSVVIPTAGLVRTVCFDWINNCALRFYRPMEDSPHAYHVNLLVGLLLGMVSAAALTLLIVPQLPGELGTAFHGLIGWLLLVVVADGFARNGEMAFRAMRRPLAFTLMRGGLAVARHVAGLMCLLIASKSLAAYLGGWGCAALLMAAIAWIATGGARHTTPREISGATLARFARFGFPLAAVVVANSMQTIGVRYVVTYLAGAEATGLYAAAYNIGGAPVTLFQSIVMLGLYPLAIDAFEKGGRIEPVVRDGLRYFVLAAVPMFLLLVLLAEPAVRLIAGQDYAEAAGALAIISAGTFLYGLAQYFAVGFLVRERTGSMALVNVSAALVNIAVAVWLVPRYGFVGAAWSTALAYGLILVGAMVWGLRPGRTMWPLRAILCGLAGCVPILAVWYMLSVVWRASSSATLVGVCLVGGGAYVAVLWMLGELADELAGVRRLWQKAMSRGDSP